MIKVILLIALAISASALGTAGTCSGTYAQCAQCQSAQASSGTGSAVEVCVNCNAGYNLPASVPCTVASSGCTTGIVGCATCAAATPTVCATCGTGYVLDSTNNICVNCVAPPTGYTGGGMGCTTCTLATKAVTCTACSATTGYVLDSTNSACISCSTGKAVTPAGTAVTYTSVVPNCLTCSLTPAALAGTSVCTVCATGYIWDSTNSACASCSAGTGTTALATAISYTSYVPGLLTCAAPTTKALAPTAPTSVASCVSGYGWDSTNIACGSCSTGKAYSIAAGTTVTATYTAGFFTACSACTVAGTAGAGVVTCTQCSTAGTVWDPTSASCVSCSTGKGTSTGSTTATLTGFDANCMTCTVATTIVTCTSCNTGYFLLYNNTCSAVVSSLGAIDAQCAVFATQNHCVSCKGTATAPGGIGLTVTASNACVQCASGCTICDTTGKICSVCGTGYKLSTTTTGTCVSTGAAMLVPGFALLSIIFYFLF